MATRDDQTAAGEPATAQPTVLFVDDEPELLKTYEALFSAEYAVVTATDGEEALRQFGEDIDVAFFDRRMPGLTGGETIQRLREQGYQTPLVVLSGIEPDEDGTIEHDAYLTKPVGAAELQATMDRFVD